MDRIRESHSIGVDPRLFFARRPRGYDAIPPVDCRCWCLTEPLAGESLPDHICHNTMAATPPTTERFERH